MEREGEREEGRGSYRLPPLNLELSLVFELSSCCFAAAAAIAAAALFPHAATLS